MKIKLIMALSWPSMGYSYKGALPWPKIPEDMEQFKRKTAGHAVLMGRKTFESVGRLPDRLSLVLSKNLVPSLGKWPASHAPDIVFRSIGDMMESLKWRKKHIMEMDIWVIGGESVWMPLLPMADEVHITWVHTDARCDRFLIPRELIQGLNAFKTRMYMASGPLAFEIYSERR